MRKFYLLLLLLACALAPTEVYPQARLSLSMQNASLTQVFGALEKQSDHIFYYRDDIPLSVNVSVNAQNQTLEQILDDVLPQGYSYRINNRQVAITYNAAEAAARYATVTGVVRDSGGQPIAGVTVVVRGTNTGAITGPNGHYTIAKCPLGDQVIEARFVGYNTASVSATQLTDDRIRTVNFTLSDGIQVGEVVVTALGIKKEEKSLGYSATALGNEDFTASTNSNWLSGLSGKVAGLNFDQSSAGPGGSIRVTLRGEGSLSHTNNDALFIVDGVPVSSGMASNTDTGNSSDDAPIDYGNGASDLNPDDIESVSILKGPAATALYGSRAAAGAVIITTKAGRETKGLGVTFNSSMVLEKVGYWPDFQNEYGPGDFRHSTTGVNEVTPAEYNFWTTPDREYVRTTSRYAFGAPWDGSMRTMYPSWNWTDRNDPESYTPMPYSPRDWYKGFYRTGVTYTNSVAIDSNNGKGNSVRVSVRDVRNEWVVPNTGYTNQNFYLSVNQIFNPNIKLGAKVTYYRKNSDNLPVSGLGLSSPLSTFMWSTPAFSVDDYWQEYSQGRIQKVYTEGLNTNQLINGNSDNPYMQLYEQINTFSRDRVYGNMSLDISLIPNVLTLMLRSGMDLNSEFRTQRKPWYSRSNVTGMYREQNVYQFEMNNDFLLTYKGYFNDFSITASAGGNSMYNNYRNSTISADRLIQPGIYALYNVDGVARDRQTTRTKGINSFYGIFSGTYKGIVYWEVTGRNDWSSTLSPANRSYFYPSVNTSLLVDEMVDMRSFAPWVDMLKVRASWANVGNDTDPYMLLDYYANSDFSGGYRLPAQINFYDLKPENIESWEFGLDMRMFRNRLAMDVTYYDECTTDQIIPIPSDWSTGASSRLINAGKVTNHGVEIALRGDVVKNAKWRWNLSANWSRNWNKLVELAPGVEQWQLNTLNTNGGLVYVYAYPGTELGRIYGTGYKRAPRGSYYIDGGGNKVDCSGEVIVDPQTGNPYLQDVATREDSDWGSIYPQWKAGLTSNTSYRNLSLSMTFSGQWGGHAYSATNAGFSYMGKLKNSLEGRYDGLIHPGVVQNTDGTFSPNTKITTDIVDYYNLIVWNKNNVETNTFSTSYLKLKEIRLTYRLSEALCKKTKILEGAELGIFATNVFCITSWPQYDPEVAALGANTLTRGVEAGAYPMTRTFGVNLKLNF